MRRLMLLDRLVEGRYCLSHEGWPSFNWKEDSLEPWIILVLEITFALLTHVSFSANRHELCTHSENSVPLLVYVKNPGNVKKIDHNI